MRGQECPLPWASFPCILCISSAWFLGRLGQPSLPSACKRKFKTTNREPVNCKKRCRRFALPPQSIEVQRIHCSLCQTLGQGDCDRRNSTSVYSVYSVVPIPLGQAIAAHLKLETPLESHAFVFFRDSLDGEHEGGSTEVDHVFARVEDVANLVVGVAHGVIQP